MLDDALTARRDDNILLTSEASTSFTTTSGGK